MLNVSFTTEHWTHDLRARYAVNYANGLLRPLSRHLRDHPFSQKTQGPSSWAKLLLAGAHKAWRGRSSRGRLPLTVDFRVDPASAEGFRSITPYEIRK
jgi:hypothetical protein